MTAWAVVAGLDLNGLGVVRSLGSAGVPVLALDTDLTKPTCATRFAETRCVSALSGQAFVEALLRVREALSENPVLLLTQEASVATVSVCQRLLSGVYRFSMPGEALMGRLLDKLEFQSLAEELGLPIPRAVRLNRQCGVMALGALRFPCVIKPSVRDAEYGRRFKKAYHVTSASDAAKLWEQMQSVISEAIVQEWIEGDDADVYFCLQYRPPSGGKATSFVGRKLRQWPPLVGGTASCVPAPDMAAELTVLTDRLFDALSFVGLCSMEYKRDRRDGRFYLVEPTVGRTDFQEEVATLNGVNIPLAAYRGELGLSPPPLLAMPRCGWRDPEGDAKARAAGMVRARAVVPLRDAYWRASDPMPFVRLHAGALGRRLARWLPFERQARAA
jgi:predicted ATP-grasp superfamily ATP-dependent carboligase